VRLPDDERHQIDGVSSPKVLREAGVIWERPCGVARMNLLRLNDLDARFPGLLPSVMAAAGQNQT
jgi:hypothetical protein